MKKIIASFLLLSALTFNAYAEGINAHRFTLQNGLEVVVVPQGNSAVVSHMLLFRAGAADDPLGSSGVAHYLEHLLFKGTKNVPEGEYSTRIDRMGGEHNAFTSADMTGYYVMADAKHLSEIMALEADRMQHYQPSDAAYAKERAVIIEERRLRIDNNPAALLDEALNAALFRHHPYGTPIIGWLHEMEQLNKTKARHFFDRYYVPNNAILLLIGNVTEAEARRLSELHYGKWRTADPISREWVNEPPRNTQDKLVMHHENVQQPRLYRSYPAPSFGQHLTENSDIYALLLAEELLGNERTGFLYRRLVEKEKVASAVSVSYFPFSRGMSVIEFSVTPQSNITLEALEAALQTALNDFTQSTVEDEALQRAKNNMKASTLYAQDSLSAMAFFLATLAMIDVPFSWFNDYPANVEAVTALQVKKAVRTTLRHNISVTGYLLPND